ncbi:MAG: hypothetical protein ACQETK_05665 [Pseudomonadota bacterium]
MRQGLWVGLLMVLVLALGSSQAGAQTSYDYQTGNSYNTIGNTTYGYNARTGSQWQTTNQGSRSRGIDSQGNHWTQDNNTGHYHNYGTGKACYGKGSARTCY